MSVATARVQAEDEQHLETIARRLRRSIRRVVNQGIEMGRPGQLFAEAESTGNATLIRIAGHAVIIGSGKLHPGSTNPQ